MKFVRIGAIFGFLAVALGAFGAHALRERHTPEMLEIFKTGVQYQAIHALALLAVGLLADRKPAKSLSVCGWLFTAGIVVFSGSLYALALSGTRVLGAITPLGGIAFLSGWLALIVGLGDR